MRFVAIFPKSILRNSVYALNLVNTIRCSSLAAHPFNKENALKSKADLSEVYRNKSRLLRQSRNVLLNVVPYDGPCSWIHETEKYKRNIFGRYGLSAGVEPHVCFSMREKFNRVDGFKEPYSLQELLLKRGVFNLLKTKAIESRELEIEAKLGKLEQWKVEMKNKIAKKEAEALAAKEHKHRLIEEVRRHFGFKVDPRDERFKEMLEKKEREEKRKQKEAKRKAKEDKMMAMVIKNS